MTLPKLPDGMRINLMIYLTNGQMNAALSLGNFSVIPRIDHAESVNPAEILRAAGFDDGDDLASWRVMTSAEIKEYQEDEA